MASPHDEISPDDVAVRASPIEGLGLFALRPFGAGQRIREINVVREITAEAPLREDLGERADHCDYPDGKVVLLGYPDRHINHSCDPTPTWRTSRITVTSWRGAPSGPTRRSPAITTSTSPAEPPGPAAAARRGVAAPRWATSSCSRPRSSASTARSWPTGSCGAMRRNCECRTPNGEVNGRRCAVADPAPPHFLLFTFHFSRHTLRATITSTPRAAAAPPRSGPRGTTCGPRPRAPCAGRSAPCRAGSSAPASRRAWW
jgi:hypothetical protein